MRTEMPRSPGSDDLNRSFQMLGSKSIGSIKEQRGCCQPDTTTYRRSVLAPACPHQNMSKFNSRPEKATNRESSNPAPQNRIIASKFSTSSEIAGIVFKRAFAIAVMAAPRAFDGSIGIGRSYRGDFAGHQKWL